MISSLYEWLISATRSPSLNWKLILVSTSLLDFAFHTYLDYREYRVQCRANPPIEAIEEKLVDDESFKKSQAYSRTRLVFGVIRSAFDQFLNVMAYKYDVLPKVWYFWVNTTSSKAWAGEKVCGVLVFLTFSAISSLSHLPFSYYLTFVIEEKFGFNKSTPALWVKDSLKSYVLGLVLLPPIVAGMLAIIEYFGNKFVPYFTFFMLMINIVGMFLYVSFLDRWFNKYTNLEAGELRAGIETLAASVNFPLGRIYVIDGSTRSNHSNAYFIGFPWYKQIVLYDTLIKEQTTDQILAVLAHELGHWKRNHMTVLRSVALISSIMTYLPLILFLGNPHFFESLRFAVGDHPIVIALIVFTDSLAPITALIKFASSYVTRLCEYDADRFAVSLGKGADLRQALINLNKSNLSDVDSDKLYTTYHHDHPLVTERLRAIKEISKKTN